MTHLKLKVFEVQVLKKGLKGLLTCFLFLLLTNSCNDKKDDPIGPGPGPGGEEEIDYSIPDSDINEMIYTPAATTFSVWAPSAEQVRVNLYQEGQGGGIYETMEMTKGEKGLWSVTAESDLKGYFYTFRVKTKEKWMSETTGIFAKAVGVNGNRAAIIDLSETNPDGWENDTRPALENISDIIIYEVHYRDFSIHASSGSSHKGKYLSLSESGTKNTGGLSTGIDHLKELGVTHVHILPSNDFSSIDETRLQENNYNWGYDPKNYNVPEGSFSSDPYDPAVRIKEFKQMVMELHKAGIRVIMDVVYNHTTDVIKCGFEQTVPGYYYRMTSNGNFSDGALCGNEMASEKPMMRKFMIESVHYWVEEYHVDGFRFDLMGLHDTRTMKDIQTELQKIDPTLYIYGEGWAPGKPGYDENNLAMKRYTKNMPGIGSFSDDLRDGIKGAETINEKGAFIFGRTGAEMSVKFGLAGAVNHSQIDYTQVNYSAASWAANPIQHISYVTCHDGLCLRDRLEKIAPAATEAERLKMNKLAQTIVFTSQGIPFIFAGEEIYRTKEGVSNSYQSPDRINAINWDNKTDYNDLFEYYKGLIALRKAHPAFRLGTVAKVRKHMDFLDVDDQNVVAFRLKDISSFDTAKSIIVAFNGNKEAVNVTVPNVEYKVLLKDGAVNVDGLSTFTGASVEVAPQSAIVLAAY